METPAQILTFEELQALGTILNYSFGKASTRDAGYGITTSLSGNQMILKYQTVVQNQENQNLRQ